ncbi:uncharacterized protein ATNIH1004_002042 [Aspergillus tanneri]|uniref:Cytochrome P450 n=1 Tax=Aspergillus tanneri TaxID=1220188 RepID=A0A5M9M2P0_9EURO|nr:uncharacterized protein ATNIH1004_002042 [Aspergillus tanneri]KAA8641302.1 hypothetical protein ATNIH1004_002042 [Aspergillus tanneri]
MVASTPRLRIMPAHTRMTMSTITAPCPIHAQKPTSLPSPVANNSVSARLVYLEYLQRHQRRTPYNILPGGENQPYNCDKVHAHLYAAPAHGVSPAQVYGQAYSDPTNPFLDSYVNGSCQYPQLTIGGLLDGYQHGRDLRAVYGDKLGLIPSSLNHHTDKKIWLRTSSSPLTQSSAGGVLRGIWPHHKGSISLHQQASGIDTVDRGFPCAAQSSLLSTIQSSPEWKEHLSVTQSLRNRLAVLFDANTSSWMSTFDHFADNFQARLCNGYELPCQLDGSGCATMDDAYTVFRAGDWEWNYWWRYNANATRYIQLVEGLFIGEIVRKLEVVQRRNSELVYSHTFVHDGDGDIDVGTLRTLANPTEPSFNGPFRIITTLGSRVILPESWTLWVKNCPDLDHPQLVRDEYFVNIPGMDGNRAIHGPSHILIDVVKTKLNQSSRMFNIHTYLGFHLKCTDCRIMHDNISEILKRRGRRALDMIHFIARISSCIFVGPELSRNPEWQDIIVNYTLTFFYSVRALRHWPGFLRPVIHWVVPECRRARYQVRRAHDILTPVLESRAAMKQAANAENCSLKFDDSIEWMEEVARGRSFDPVAAQLGMAMGALHTTTELIKQTILDICMHSELIQTLREEIMNAVGESGWTTAGLFKMKLLDSVIKETQRLKPGALVNLERKTINKVTLPNGMVLPCGTSVAVECTTWSDAETYPSPERYDGYRFLKMREQGDTTAVLSSTSPKHVAFGIGRSICPGRFLAANEAKIVVAKILLDYDIRLEEGYQPYVVHYGFEMLSDPSARVEVRRR